MSRDLYCYKVEIEYEDDIFYILVKDITYGKAEIRAKQVYSDADNIRVIGETEFVDVLI